MFFKFLWAKEKRAYVVSQDIEILLKRWAAKRNFVIPQPAFFDVLRKQMKKELEEIFGCGNVDFVSSQEIKEGIKQLLKLIRLPAVSLDEVHFPTLPSLRLTRTHDASLRYLGLMPPHRAPSFEDQLKKVQKFYKGKKIVLIDSVLFTGQLISYVNFHLNRIEVKPKAVIVGIARKEGVENLRKLKLLISVVRYYKDMIDQIEERDFYVGVPLGGRSILSQYNWGAPYIAPFGDPSWASIPKEKFKEFSRFCLELSVQLWEEIEKMSGKRVMCSDLDRLPLGVRPDKVRFVEVLKKILRGQR